MSTVAQVREALAAALAGIPDLYVSARWPGQINGDAAVVRRLATDFGRTFDGDADGRYGITLYVALVDNDTAQQRLDAYLSKSGARSVKAAVELAGPTLAGVVDFVTVDSCEEEGIVEVPAGSGLQFLSATVNLTVGD